MAKPLNFPIGFDLKSGVQNATADWKNIYAKKLESEFAKNPIKIKLKVGTTTSEIKDLKKLKEEFKNIKIEPFDKTSKKNIQSLAQELKLLANALKEVQKYSKTVNVGKQALANAIQQKRFEQRDRQLAINERKQTSVEDKVAIQRDRLTMAQQRHNTAMTKANAQLKKMNSQYRSQYNIIQRLAARAGVYASFYAVGNFLSDIRKVTAEFELQRISLGAIIQDQNNANKLFAQIKDFAIKSPLSVMDLTNSIKKVAAYRIETDKLFDTTKRLADVSVGLGVSMDRLVLAYGQTKAASYLRAAEIRQYTEAGLPMLELLAEKFTVLEGRAVSTGEVMDRVSKRMVSFEMVEEIFEDLTNKGGMFYNMQEKQSQTLFGMWAKLGDAYSIMVDSMGSSTTLNNAMKTMIDYLMKMIDHWETLADVVKNGALAFGVYKIAMAGLIPSYKLQRTLALQQLSLDAKREYSLMKQTARLGELDQTQKGVLYRQGKLTQAQYAQYITGQKLNQQSALTLARQSKGNVALQRALVNSGLYNKAQLQSIQTMTKWQFATTRMRFAVSHLGMAFKSLGASLVSFAPLMAITAVISLVTEVISTVTARSEELEKNFKAFDERRIRLNGIAVSLQEIRKQSESSFDTMDEALKSSYSSKVKELEKIIQLLKEMGQYNVIDLSLVNANNIDEVLDRWVDRIESANDAARQLGGYLTDAKNSIEFGGIFGENITSDFKDLRRAYTGLISNQEFTANLEKMRNVIKDIKLNDIELYNRMTKLVQTDAELAIGQKRRNESELQYQKRIYANYNKLTNLVRGYKKVSLFDKPQADFSTLDDYETAVQEIRSELEDFKKSMSGQDAMTVKIAIDTLAAKEQWADWQKEEVINFLNDPPVTINAEIIPQDRDKPKPVLVGTKAILETEFPTLFSKDELAQMGTDVDIVEKLDEKLKNARESLKKWSNIASNPSKNGTATYEKQLEQLNNEIEEYTKKSNRLAELKAIPDNEKDWKTLEIQAELQKYIDETDRQLLENNFNQVKAILEAETLRTEQKQQQIESLREEIRLTELAKERLSSGSPTIAKDIRQNFSSLVVDENNTNPDYAPIGLFTEEDLNRLKNGVALQEVWRQKMKDTTEAKKEAVAMSAVENGIASDNNQKLEQKKKLDAEIAAIEAERSKMLLSYPTSFAFTQPTKNVTTTAKDLITYSNQYAKAIQNENTLKYEGLSILLAEKKAQRDRISLLPTNEDYIKQVDETLAALEALGKKYGLTLEEIKQPGGTAEDPFITLIKNRMKFMQDFQKGTSELSEFMGKRTGLGYERENMQGRGLSLDIDTKKLDGSKKELIKWYEDTIKTIQQKIAQKGGKEWQGLGVQLMIGKNTKNKVIKAYQDLLHELFKSLTDFRTDDIKKIMEEKLKQLAEDVKRTKIAQDFFNEILGQTGDIDLAGRVSFGIYGESGSDLYKKQVEQLKELFNTEGNGEAIDLGLAVDPINERINYKTLEDIYNKYQDKIKEKNKETIKSIIQEGQKESASFVKEIEKNLAKFKDYEAQRAEISRKAATEREAILKSTAYTQPDKERLVQASKDKEEKELTKIDVKEFTESERYIKTFQDVTKVAKNSLVSLRAELVKFIENAENLEPQVMKALVDALEKIDKELKTRKFNIPILDFANAYGGYKKTKANETTAKAEYKAKEPELDLEIKQSSDAVVAATANVNKAKEELIATEQRLQAVIQSGTAPEKEVAQAKEAQVNAENRLTAAQIGLNSAEAKEVKAKQKKAKEQKKVEQATEETEQAQDGVKKACSDWKDEAKEAAEALGKTADLLEDVKDLLGIAEDSTEGIAFDAAIQGLRTMQTLITIMTAAQAVFNTVANSNPIGMIAMALAAVIATFTFFVNNKAAQQQKKIDALQEQLDRLEYTYERLEKAQEKTFGGEYITRYNLKMKNLMIQQKAYQQMAEYERNKGKKADKEKEKEYLDSARDLADEIADMATELSEKFTDTDLASAAKDFAQSWLDAKLSFANTTNAMSNEFREMMRNIVVNSFLARIVQMRLQPIFDEIDRLAKDGELSALDVAKVSNMLPGALNDMNEGLETAISNLQRAGINVQDLADKESQFTGIARDISSASEESINGLAAGINTQNHYISYVPTIANDVAVMRSLMEKGGGLQNNSDMSNLLDYQSQGLSNLQAINRNTAETVNECRNIYYSLSEVLTMLDRVIKPRGIKSTHTINVNI